ncbi:MAG: hypothetical protein HY719_17700 [Planctomycetes bacterium]|nr:hypothetical protein [Planctomycetota bacterium]
MSITEKILKNIVVGAVRESVREALRPEIENVVRESVREALRPDRENIARMFDEVRRHFADVDKRFDGVDKRFDGVDKRFDGVDKRFDGVDKRFDGVDKRLDGVDRRLEILAHTDQLLFDLVVKLAGQTLKGKARIAFVERADAQRNMVLARFFQVEEQTGNPLTRPQLKRLKGYYVMMRRKRKFTLRQARDFRRLAEIAAFNPKLHVDAFIGATLLLGLSGLILAAAEEGDWG